jgi:hypothetical protein
MYTVSFSVRFVPSGSVMYRVISRVMFPALSQDSFVSVMILGVFMRLPPVLVVWRPLALRPLIRSWTLELISWFFLVPLTKPAGTLLAGRAPGAVAPVWAVTLSPPVASAVAQPGLGSSRTSDGFDDEATIGGGCFPVSVLGGRGGASSGATVDGPFGAATGAGDCVGVVVPVVSAGAAFVATGADVAAAVGAFAGGAFGDG